MTKEELKTKLTELVHTATFDEAGEWLNVLIDAKDWLPMAKALRNYFDLQFDYLFNVTAVDWKTYLSVVYHLRSTKLEHVVVVKAKIADRNNPEIETVSNIWRTACAAAASSVAPGGLAPVAGILDYPVCFRILPAN